MDIRRYFYSIIIDERKGVIAFLLRFILWPFSLAYGLLIKCMVKSYRWNISKTAQVGCKVISVGNITLGGTGKTPVVEWIARRLKDTGENFAILLRGYGRLAAHPSPFVAGEASTVEQIGDEAYFLRENLPDVPIIVGQDRAKGAEEAIKRFGVRAVILDDGFQHWRLSRDLDIVTIDTTSPFGNGATIPRGTLREPISHLGRADIFLLTRSNVDRDNLPYLKNILKRLNPKADIIETIHAPSHFEPLADNTAAIEISAMTNRCVCVLSAIGNPVAFDNMVEGLFLKVGMRAHFIDHHNYSRSDIADVIKNCRDAGIYDIVTTQKDGVKLRPIVPLLKGELEASGVRLLILKSRIEITSGEDILIGRLDSLLSG